MAGISWAQGVSNGTNFPISNGTNFFISNVTKATSGAALGADLQHPNGTKFPFSNMINSISGAALGADLQHPSGTKFPFSNMINSISGAALGADLHHSNGTKFPFSNMINSISGAALGADLQHPSGTKFPVSNGTNFLISNMTNSISGAALGADFQHPNGTNSLMSNMTEATSGADLGADLQPCPLFAVPYSAVLLLGLAGNALSLSLLPCRAKPLSHSYLLLLQLALLDTLLLAVLPLHIHSQLLGDTWTFGDTACRVTGALFSLHLSLSVAFFGCLAVDVWLALLHPFTSIRLRATHYLLLATALWLVALGGTVPLVLHSREVRSCLGSWAEPTAPQSRLGLIFGVAVPVCVALLGSALRARGRRRAARRRALGTISIVLGICALCFLPHQLCQLLQLLLGPLPRLQRVTELLACCSCCLNPLLYHFHCSSRAWHCPCRLSLRTKRVFTICDKNFGDPSWDYRPGWRHGMKIHRDGINSRYSQN